MGSRIFSSKKIKIKKLNRYFVFGEIVGDYFDMERFRTWLWSIEFGYFDIAKETPSVALWSFTITLWLWLWLFVSCLWWEEFELIETAVTPFKVDFDFKGVVFVVVEFEFVEGEETFKMLLLFFFTGDWETVIEGAVFDPYSLFQNISTKTNRHEKSK